MRRLLAGAAASVLLLTGCTTGGVQRGDGGDDAGPAVSSAPRAPDANDAAVEEARLVAGIADCPDPDPAAEPRADGLPDLVLPCLGGGSEVSLAQLRGTPMVLNAWASWCPPCRDEAPYLAEVAAETEDEVLTLGLLFNESDKQAAIELAAAHGQLYPELVDDEAAIRQPLRAPAPPITWFVSAEGEIVHTHLGPFTSSEQLRGLVAEHLDVGAGAVG